MLNSTLGRGWLRDYPDYRDYTYSTGSISESYRQLGYEDITSVQDLPESVDLREWCSPIKDQGRFNSCTAYAGVGLIEYFIQRAFGKDFAASPFFLYKVTRNLLGFEEDKGAFLRTTMKAMVIFGVPSEDYCVLQGVNDEPSAFCYALAQNYQAEEYYRLDAFDTSPDELLHHIKMNLSFHLPSMFGFSTYSSLDDAFDNGHIPFPSQSEDSTSGHAVVAVGYNDTLEITNQRNQETTVGALLIRNSWGESWGESGYGWLPYAYVQSGLTSDWWSLLSNEWINTGQFG